MPADASVYGQIKPVTPMEGPLDQFGKVLNLKALMGQGQLQQLQTQKLQRDIGQEDAVQKRLSSLAPGETIESVLPEIDKLDYKAGMNVRSKLLETKTKEATLKHTEAQTGDITAGHVAGAWAALAKAGGSDDAVKQVHDTMAPLVGEQQATAVTQKLLSMPPEMRLPWMTAQAGTHKTGQEALKLFFPPAQLRDTGGEVQPVSTSTLPGGPLPGTPIPGTTPIQKTATPGEKMTDARQRELNGILDGQNGVDMGPIAESIAKGDMPAPNMTMTRNPAVLARNAALIAKVKEINPNWSADTFNTTKQTTAAFAKGKQGDAVKAINTSIDHLDTLSELGSAMKNGNMQIFNKIANEFAAQTGQSAPSNFNAAKNIIAAEVVKGISGSGGGVEDRNKAQAAFDAANSPEKLEWAIATVKKLLGGQLKGLEQQYTAGTSGRKDFREKYLTEAGRKAFDTSKEGAHGSPAAAPGAIVATVKTDADYEKLKPGTRFIAPDGTTRTKQ